MRRILLLARSLERGGTETQIIVLARALVEAGCQVTVATFYDAGPRAGELIDAGVTVTCAGKNGRWDVAGFLLRMARLIRRFKPEVIYSFLPMANIVAVLLRPFLPGCRVVWGVRRAQLDLARYDRVSRLSYALERRLAPLADGVLINSEAGRRQLIREGWRAGKLAVVVNGIDTVRYAPHPEWRTAVRAELGLGEQEPVVGCVARIDPIKGHDTMLAALRLMDGATRLVLAGGGQSGLIARLRESAAALGLTERILWLEDRDDVPRLYQTFDVATSASLGEGFPNVVAEAMACGLPVVATDVGDCAAMIGATGRIVPPGNPMALAAAWQDMLALGPDRRRRLGDEARTRIIGLADAGSLAQRTLDAF